MPCRDAVERRASLIEQLASLPPSTLSHSLRSLEERLGIQSVARTKWTVAPTATGVALLAQIGPLLTGMDDALEAVNVSPAPAAPLTPAQNAASR